MWATFPLGVDAILKYARDGLKAGSVRMRITYEGAWTFIDIAGRLLLHLECRM
jgi:hypothetical protein